MKTLQRQEKQASKSFPEPPAVLVLLIDDQTIVAESVRRLLDDRPTIELHYCADAVKAVRTANEIRPTVILQDWVMPSIDGLELLRMFRTNPTTANTPIIVLSSEDDPKVKREAFAAGANDYLVKLPDRIELIARIESHSKAYSIQRERDEAFRNLRESQLRLADSNAILVSLNHKVEEAYQKLNVALQETEQRAREAIQLTELIDVLQSCQSLKEAYDVVRNSLPWITASPSGALCITSSSRNVVEAVAAWGEIHGSESTFDPAACWALRRGKIHLVKGKDSPMRCSHVVAPPEGGYVCVPMAAQGETLGVLYLEWPAELTASGNEPSTAQIDAFNRRAASVGQRISLALANLGLREVLRSQSIRDPLTGLFNRRYMEESMDRELRRAKRNNESCAVMLLDIDHFKRFNDTFGHPAGDALLRALGEFLKKNTRAQDIACRYGGEEFALVMSGTSVVAAIRCAEVLREELKKLAVEHVGQILGGITLSVGVALYPDHAGSIEELLRLADEALYRAKHEGRDRVIASHAVAAL